MCALYLLHQCHIECHLPSLPGPYRLADLGWVTYFLSTPISSFLNWGSREDRAQKGLCSGSLQKGGSREHRLGEGRSRAVFTFTGTSFPQIIKVIVLTAENLKTKGKHL